MTTSLNDKITEVLKGFIQYTCKHTNMKYTRIHVHVHTETGSNKQQNANLYLFHIVTFLINLYASLAQVAFYW